MSDSQTPNQGEPVGKPEIVVDSDWKEQVAKEKQQAETADTDQSSEELASSEAEPSSAEAAPELAESAAESTEATESAPPAPLVPPPASFEVLISMLFTQAMMTLGQMPDPTSEKVDVNKPFAKHYIDTLDMISEKTKGNLSVDEAKMLSEALHALRMMYVNVKSK